MAVRRPCRSPGNRVTDEFSLHLLDLDTRVERTLNDLIDYGGFDLWGGLVVWIGGTLESPQVLLHTIASGLTRRIEGLDYPSFAVRTDGRRAHRGKRGRGGRNETRAKSRFLRSLCAQGRSGVNVPSCGHEC